MEHVNIADGNDRVTIQAGQIITNTDFTDGVAIQVGEVIRAENAAHTEPDTDTDTDPEARVVNVRSGNARVGMQADVIHIRW